MAKKINRSNKKKQKLVRSSSIQKTIDEGKDYVNRADRRIRLNARKVIPTTLATNAVSKPKKKLTKKQKNASRAPRKAAASVRAPAPAPAPISIFVPPAATTTGVARSSSKNLSRSGSKNVARTGSNNQIVIEQELHDRLGRHNANIGKLNFSLRWWDPNDLDLHVICPCKTQICYMNKKCTKCGGQLDIDMNVGLNMSLQPVQHVYFNNPKSGLYKFFVQYFYGPKQFSGVKGAQKSKYALSLHQDLNQLFRYQDTVSTTQRQIHYDFTR